MRTKLSSSAIWEDTIGYSRAVRVGNIIEIAGTAAVKNGEVVHTRIYLKNVNDWEEVGRAHGEYFSKIKPASTMIAVSSMINQEMLVEIEATAIIS